MLLPIGELSREFHVDPTAIRRAVEKGQITRRDDGLFDTDIVFDQWRDNVAHERGHGRASPRVVQMRQEAPTGDGEIPERPTKGSDYAKARAAVQIYEARLKKLRYEERAKNLAPTCDIEQARFQEMRIIRDACLNLPARISAQLAAESDEHRCYQLLENELLLIFTDYAEGKLA